MTGDPSTDRVPLAPATIEVVYTWPATIFGAALVDQAISRSPCQQIRLPEIQRPKVEPLPVETVEKLVEAVPDRTGR